MWKVTKKQGSRENICRKQSLEGKCSCVLLPSSLGRKAIVTWDFLLSFDQKAWRQFAVQSLQSIEMGSRVKMVHLAWNTGTSSSLGGTKTMQQSQSNAVGKGQGIKQGCAACNTILQGQGVPKASRNSEYYFLTKYCQGRNLPCGSLALWPVSASDVSGHIYFFILVVFNRCSGKVEYTKPC